MAAETQDEAEKSSVPEFLRNPRVWLGVIIALLAIAFIAQNRGTVNADLLWLTFAAPQWVTLAIVFVAGLLTGLLMRQKKSKKDTRKKK